MALLPTGGIDGGGLGCRASVEAYLRWHFARLGNWVACWSPTKGTVGTEAIVGARIHCIVVDRVQAAGRG